MTVETKTLRVALYGRVSTTDQAENGKSLLDQEQTLRQWAKLQGWQVVAVYIDKGVSGGTDDRPELQNLLLDAKNHRFDLVLATKLDRVMRNTRLTLNTIEDLKKSDVALVTMDGTDTRQGGIADIMLSMLAAMAQYERIRIAERITAARAYRRAQNQWSAGRVLFGYRFDKESKQLLICEPEAEAIRQIFNIYTTQKIGIANLAELMNKTNYLPPHRKNQKYDYWRGFTILHILKHPGYRGGPSDQWPYKTPAIITPELWQQAQVQRANNFHFRPSDQGKTKYQSRLFCGLCGHTLTLERNGGKRRVYSCPGRKRIMHPDGSQLCTLPRFEAVKLDRKIKTKINKIFSDPELLLTYFVRYQGNLEAEQKELETRLKPMRIEADGIKEEMAIVNARLEMKQITIPDYKARISELKARLASVEQRSEDLDPTLLNKIKDIASVGNLYGFVADKLRRIIDGTIKTDEIRIMLPDFPNADVPTAMGVFLNMVKDPVKVGSKQDNPLSEMLGDIFKYFIVYPDKIELRGTIDIAKLNPSLAPNILQQNGRKV